MKPRILSSARLSFPLAAALAAMLAAPAAIAQAVNGTWDGGGTSAIWGGVNNWNPNGTIANNAGATATFGTGFASGTNIQVNTNRTIGNINHNSTTTDITISQTNSSVFTLDVTSGSPTVTVGTAARTLTITAPISGNDGMTKAGAGTCILSGLNLFTGNVAVTGGTLVAGIAGNGGNSAFGGSLSSKTITVNSGANLRFDVGNVFNNNFASAATSLPTMTIAGTLTNGGTATNSALGNITLAGGTLTATVGSGSGYGSWNLNGTVTSTGTSTISTSAAVPITLSAAAGTTTTFDVQSGTLNASAALGEVTAAGDERVSGLSKIGAGTMVLSGINTYTGNAAISAGTLTIATKDALPGYNTNGRYSVAAGATLAVQNGVADSEITEMLATNNFVSGANLGFDTAAGNRSVPLNLADTANGPLGIVKLGANTLTLSGTNSHTGGTSVTAGALNITSTGALPGWNVNGGFSIASGASLVIPNSVSESEVTTILGTTNIAAGASLLFDTSAGDRTYVSALTDSATGLLNVGKIGANTLTLAGDSTYTGSTNVTSGTLSITGSITGLPGSSKININPASGNAILNYNGGASTLFAITGSTVAGTASVFNMSGGDLTISPGVATGTQNVTGAGNGAGNGAYGYYNITGGTFKNVNRFTVTGQASASATNGTGAGIQTGVVYVGGTGFIDQTNGEWWLNYSLGQVTVAESGKIDRTGSTAPFGIFMNHATNVTGGGYGVLNLAGTNAQVILGAQPIRFGNSTTSTQGSGQSGFVNVAAGTLSVGANANTSLPASPVSINNAYFNFAGGTVQASANLSGWIPVSNASINFNSNIFGPVDNPGTAEDFTGGLTLDSGGFDVAIANPLQAPGGFGVTQADLSVSGGSGYVGAPAVIFSSADVVPGGSPAAGYAKISGGAVTGIVITSPGTYLAGTTPTVTLIGGGGSGASVSSGVLGTANASGGLTKTGAGVLTLSGANTYTGATAVNAGTLNLTGSLASNITVASNANLAGEGSTTGSLTFSGTSDLGFDPSTAADYLDASTVVASGASVTVVPSVPFTGNGIVVLDAPGGITGTAGGAGNNFIYTGRGNLYLNGGNTQLLIDTAPVNLAWRGNDGTNPSFWDLNTTANWDNGGPEKFFTGDAVTFDDTATSYTVNINAANVFAGNIVFNNTTTYTLQGAFGIFGGSTLTKGGAGTVVMNAPNAYTGATSVNAGVLNIRNASALGSTVAATTVAAGAALEIQGGITTAAESLTIDGSGILNSGALRSISGNNAWGTTVTLAGAATIGTDAGTLTLPSLTGAFGLTKVGAGTLNITGATAVTSTTVEAGTLYMGSQTGASTTTSLGASNPVTLNGSSNLTIRRTNTGVANLLGAISGTGSLTLLGDNANTRAASDFALNDASDFSGGTTVIGARANITTSGSALGTGLVTTGTNGQVFVQTAGLTLANDLAIGGIGWDENSGFLGALRLNSTTVTGDITLTSDTRITGAGTSELSGIISGGFAMDFFEDTVIGTITLSGDNDYTGQTIINSVGAAPATLPNLIVGHNNALGTTAAGTVVNGTGTGGSGSLLTLADGITVTGETLTLDATASGYRASLITAANGSATWDGNVITGGTGGFLAFNANGASSNLTVGSSDTDTITGTNSIAMRGDGTGTVNSAINIGTSGIFKTDASVWTITSNNNAFTGTPAIANGILSVGTIADAGVNSALGAGTTISLGQNAGSGTLRFTGASGGSSNRAITIANGTTGAGVIENAVAGQTLTLSGDVTSATPANAHSLTLTGAGNGVLGGSITGSPALALNKAGGGAWTLSGVNTYTGTTTIDNGTLAFSADQSLTGGLTFGATNGGTSLGALDLSSASATFAGAALVQTNNVTPNTITIGATKSLTLNGGLTMGYDAGAGTGATNSNLTVAGAGSMAINGTTINVSVNQAATNAGYWSDPTLDVSGLANFSTDVTTFNIGVGTTTQGPGTVLLSNTANTIIATTLTAGNTGGNNGRGTGLLVLGTGTNVIQADTINIGRSKSVTGGPTGAVRFASQDPGSPGTVTITDRAGTGRANIDIANQGATSTGGGATGSLDLRGHVATVSAGTVAIGSVTAASNSGGPNGTLSFDGGTFDVNTLTMATKSGGSTGTARGTVNIGGGTFTVNTAFNMGSQAGAGASNATVNLTGGTLSSFASIVKGTGTTTATINLSGGTLDLNGNAIGSVGEAIVLNAESGTLKNVATINGTGGLTKTTAGTLVVEGTNPYSGNTTVTEGILTLSNAAGAGNANTLNDSSSVNIAATGATLNLAYTGTDVVNELYIGGVLQAPGVWGAVGSGAPKQDSRITGTGTLTVSTGTTGFTTWISGTFANGTVPEGLRGPNDDPDNDGIPNLVEYAIASQDPTVSNPTVGTYTGTSLSFDKRQPLASDITYAIQQSTDLGLVDNWAEVSGGSYTNISTTISYTFTPGTPAKEFYRLSVTQNP